MHVMNGLNIVEFCISWTGWLETSEVTAIVMKASML